jgi:Uma2 family endonuclease
VDTRARAAKGDPDLFARGAAAVARDGAPAGKIVRPLVPDVGYLAYAALSSDAPRDEVEVPLGPPTVAVEILSPDDRGPDVDDKIHVYLAAGTALVVVDPKTTRIELHDPSAIRVLVPADVLAHDALPGFTLDVGALFERARR